MKDRKTTTLVYDGLGLPVRLINVPMKKILGQWFLDINMETLQRIVLEAVLHKHAPLTGDEIKFIRKYLELSTKAFGEIFGVSHAAVVKWETKKNGLVPALDLCIRLHIMNCLKAKDGEFRALYNELNLRSLSKPTKGKIVPIIIDCDEKEELKMA